MSPKALLCAALAAVAVADLDFSRVHVIDTIGNNFLFRSNMPLVTVNGQKQFAYQNLTAYMGQRALEEANKVLPPRFYLQIMSFDNILEISDTQYEVDFFNANPALGNITFWPLLGQLLPPSLVDNTTRQYYVDNETALWGIDQLPTRLEAIHTLLATPRDPPMVLLVHCEAGCDRTGEFSAGYYMRWQNMNVTASWAKDILDCGREPEYWSKNAIQWYCLTLEHEEGNTDAGNCMGF